jgi:hypothetical protein
MPSMPSMPSLPSFGGGGPAAGTATIRLESEPPGADARTTGGQGCRTPCSLTVTAQGNFTVNFTLNGYLPQSVTAQVVAPDDIRSDEFGGSSTEVRIAPNPIFAALDLAPPPPPAQRRKPPPRKPRPPAQAANPPPSPDANMGMTPPPSSALTPFPSR